MSAVAALAGLVCVCQAGEPRVEILDYGLYSTATVFKTQITDGITHRSVSNLVLSVQSTNITARMGEQIGFRYVIHANGTLPTSIVHAIYSPRAIVNPETGVRFAPFIVPLTEYPTNSFIGYSFDQAWECVEGAWTFVVGTMERPLTNQVITVKFKGRGTPKVQGEVK